MKIVGTIVILTSLAFGYYMIGDVIAYYSNPEIKWGHGVEINTLYGMIFLLFTVVGIGAGMSLIVNKENKE